MKSPTDFLKKEHFRDEYPDDFAAKQQNTALSEEKRKELETENRKQLSESEKIRLKKKMMVEFKESIDSETLILMEKEALEMAKEESPEISELLLKPKIKVIMNKLIVCHMVLIEKYDAQTVFKNHFHTHIA
jgi:ATP-dependent 26S proteasome regulatory subunit